MNGELTVLGECLVLVITLLFSTTGVLIGRRLPFPACLTAYGSALAVWAAWPLLVEANLRRVDQVLGVVGCGLLLAHLAFMVLYSGMLLTVVFMTQQWSRRHRLALGGAVVLTAVFVLCWLAVKSLPLAESAAVFYGVRAGHPPAAFWMNISMGFGFVYIASWNVVEFAAFLRGARVLYEQGYAAIGLILYVLSVVGGTLTMVEAVGRRQGVDVTGLPPFKARLTLCLAVATVLVLAGQLWLLPLWRRRRQLLLRYVAPDLVCLQERVLQTQNTLLRLQNNLLNLIARQAEIHLEVQYEAYANRAIVEAVEERCCGTAVTPERRALARMAVILLTTQRSNLIEDPQYGREKSWDDLMTEATEPIDQGLALNAWERARQDSYIYQDIYIVMFLVLDSPNFRKTLLIHESPQQVQPWHEALADLIATVMQEHGHSTPRAVALAQRGASAYPAVQVNAL